MKHDVICLGRLALDLYAEQLGARLEDATSFAKYLGGSSANIALGCARLGLQAAMLSRVGDDHAGRFLTETLAAAGCDVSHVSVDRERLTALVLLGILDRASFPHVFYRENCADMAIQDSDVDERFLADSRALVITGTHFSTEHTHRVSSLALERARRLGVATVLDIDYRPALWGLAGPAAGDNRYIASDRVTAHLQGILGQFDLVVGTCEEIRIAGGSEEFATALAAVRAITSATIVVKRGADGCEIFDGGAVIRVPGFAVPVMNELGAGDAFMAGLLKGWLTGGGWYEAGRLGNACGAIVVSRHGCSAAMPGPAELAHFLAHPVASDPHLARLHRVTSRRRQWRELYLLAIDHRSLHELARETGAPDARLLPLVQLLVRAVAETEEALALRGHVGVRIDDPCGDDALRTASGRGWWLGRPVEIPGSSPLVFSGGRSIGSRLVAWPRNQVVTCRVRFHPDAPVEDRLEDETQLHALYDAITTTGHELALEVVPPRSLGWDGQTVVRALRRLYNIGIHPDWWTLEAAPSGRETWQDIDALLTARDPGCRGVLLLGQDASADELRLAFRDAAARTCRGFLVGHAVVREPSGAWLSGRIDDSALVAAVRARFEELISAFGRARHEAT